MYSTAYCCISAMERDGIKVVEHFTRDSFTAGD